MGLLDGLLGSSFDDPKTAAAMQLAQGLLSAPRAMQGLSGGLLGYQQQMAAAKQQAAAEELRKMQLAQHALAFQQAQKAAEQADKDRGLTQQAFTPIKGIEANQASGIAGPRPEALNVVGQLPKFDPAQFIASGGSADKAFALQQALMKEQPKLEKFAPGEVGGYMKDGTFRQVVSVAPKDDAPSEIKQYLFAVGQGEKRTFTDWAAGQKKAGATNLSVSMDKGFGTTFADNAAKDLGASRDKARAAANTINTLNSIDGILDSGKVATGPTQPFQMFGMQMAQTLGIGGKDNAEKLANTRHLITNAANLSLDGAARMAGQGQITEAERALIKDAAAGNIDRLTPPEIKMLTGALRKVNSGVITGHQSLLKNVGPQFEQFKPFYNVDIPSAPTGSGGWGIRPVGG